MKRLNKYLGLTMALLLLTGCSDQSDPQENSPATTQPAVTTPQETENQQETPTADAENQEESGTQTEGTPDLEENGEGIYTGNGVVYDIYEGQDEKLDFEEDGTVIETLEDYYRLVIYQNGQNITLDVTENTQLSHPDYSQQELLEMMEKDHESGFKIADNEYYLDFSYQLTENGFRYLQEAQVTLNPRYEGAEAADTSLVEYDQVLEGEILYIFAVDNQLMTITTTVSGEKIDFLVSDSTVFSSEDGNTPDATVRDLILEKGSDAAQGYIISGKFFYKNGEEYQNLTHFALTSHGE